MAILYQNEPKIWNGRKLADSPTVWERGKKMVYFLGGVRLLHTHSPRQVHQKLSLAVPRLVNFVRARLCRPAPPLLVVPL